MAVTFKAVLASGGTKLTIVFTTSDTSLYGQTITISKNGTTVGTTAFDNTGNAEYTVKEAGTYSVVCGAASDTVEVTDEFPVELSAIPDGSTAVPVNDIQTWLQCAGIFNKTSYTTLADVLADTTTLLALINSNNAVDYMVRSHDWCDDVCADATAMTYIGANNYAADTLLADSNEGLVPTMTSDTTPSGEAYASSVYGSSYHAYCAFCGKTPTTTTTDSTWVGAAGDTVGAYVAYDFGEPTVVQGVTFTTYASSPVIKIQGSNSKTSGFEDVGSSISVSGTSGQWTTTTASFVNATAYRYLRIYFSGGTYAYNYVHVGLAQFYAKDGSWLESICNSQYFESVLNVKVPTMTSNTTPSGQCIGSGETSTYYKAFDGDNSTYFYIRNNTGYSDYVGYTFTAAVKVFKVGVIVGAVVLYIEGLNGASWESIGEIKGAGSTLVYTRISPNSSYSNYRVRLKTPYGSTGTMPIYTLQFYGRAAS